MRSHLLVFTLGLVIFSLFLPLTAKAQLVIDVDPSKFRKYPIAVTKLKNFGETEDTKKLDSRFQVILINDLEIAGLFELLNPKSFLENPNTSGITESTTNFTEWLQVGAEGLVKGGFWINGEKVKADLRLFDVALGKEMLAKTYEVDIGDFRPMVHTFADSIVSFFTKEQGIFSTKIVAVRRLNKTKHIYLMDFDGKNGHTLVENSNLNLLPAWAPDGKSVYFTSYISGNPDLYETKSTPGGDMKKISGYRGLNVGVSASLDGKRIALTLSKDGNSEIYVMNGGGGRLIRVTHSWGIDTSPSWAPDSKRIAFVSDRSGSPQIYVTEMGTGMATRLTFQGNYNQSPAWSPKDGKVAFCGRDERLVFDLFLVDVETREITRLTQDQGNNEDPSWSPDGRHLVFSSTRKGESKLFIMNADGTNQRIITRGKGAFSTPDWSPRSGGVK